MTFRLAAAKSYGHDMNKAVDAVVGGWEISPIVSWRTGWPLAGLMAARITLAPSPAAPGQTAIRFRSLHGYTIPGVGVSVVYQQWKLHPTGTRSASETVHLSWGACVGHITLMWILSLHKDFQMTERFKLQFRTDFINAFNHVNFEAPNTASDRPWGRLQMRSRRGIYSWRLKLYF